LGSESSWIHNKQTSAIELQYFDYAKPLQDSRLQLLHGFLAKKIPSQFVNANIFMGAVKV
jgi:hypothetical protein